MATAAQPPLQSKPPVSVRDKWRSKTNYKAKRLTGYAPISFAMVAEVGRLSAGKATQLLYVILSASLGRIVRPDEPFKENAENLKTSELSELCGCDERTIQRELTDLKRRSLIAWEQSKKGWNNITPLFRSWASLPDYKAGPVEEPEPEAEQPAENDPAKAAGERTVLTAKPVRCAPGRPSKPIKVPCGIVTLQFLDDIASEFSAVVEPGGALLVSRRTWKASDGVVGLPNSVKQTKEMDAVPRQGCRGNGNSQERIEGEKRIEGEQVTGGQSSPGGRGSQSRQGIPPVQKQARQPQPDITSYHPRSKELADLFDPFLLKSCGKSLSGDHTALLAACEAIQDTDHDFVVKCVVDRAARPISGPRAAVAICKEIAHNWKKAKDLPAAKKLPTREEYLAIAAKERAERLGKKGRVA
jgi:hypothetical protein